MCRQWRRPRPTARNDCVPHQGVQANAQLLEGHGHYYTLTHTVTHIHTQARGHNHRKKYTTHLVAAYTMVPSKEAAAATYRFAVVFTVHSTDPVVLLTARTRASPEATTRVPEDKSVGDAWGVLTWGA
jgi:hypothetical protein